MYRRKIEEAGMKMTMMMMHPPLMYLPTYLPYLSFWLPSSSCSSLLLLLYSHHHHHQRYLYLLLQKQTPAAVDVEGPRMMMMVEVVEEEQGHYWLSPFVELVFDQCI